MIVVEDLLKNMKKHFPRWMDIRRKNSSSGSLLLESIAEETANVQFAIEDYKRDFFLNKYMGDEDNVIAFIYKAVIGKEEEKDFILITPDIEVVTKQDDFYSKENVCLYSEGILYFKEDYEEILCAIEGYKFTATLEKMHVWNIFDEFAVFVGLRRYTWETNKELLNRILAKANRKINSSEDGIKEALLTNLINLAPNLKKEDILIEQPTPENLIKYYNDFETILDHLNEVNRDVYKNKKWDVDTWNFDIKSIDYMPHAWDVALKNYANGIGDNDDLKVSIIDNNSKTDATISFYKKKDEVINSYVKNNNIKENFKLSLKKYDNDLKIDKVNYKIYASESKKIDTANTIFNFYEEKTNSSKVLLQNVADNFLVGVTVDDKSNLDSNFKYKLRFIPTDPIVGFRIDECSQASIAGDKVNLIKEQSGFKFIDDKKSGVISGNTIKYITDKYQYSSIDNAVKTIDGFIIDDISEEATFKVNLNGCANENLYYDYDKKEVPILYNNVTMNNCYIQNDNIIPDTVDGDKFIEINTKMNSISMTIEGPYSIEYSINDNGIKTISDYTNVKYEFKIDGYFVPQIIKIKIKLHDISKCKVNNIMYSKFELNMTTDNGSFNHSPLGTTLPSYDANNLTVTMRTYTGFSPVLKYIYIGTLFSDSDYYGDIDFDPANGVNLITKYKGCRLQLTKLNADNTVAEVMENYIPYKHYAASNNNVQIELLLSDYTEIQTISADGCEIETINYGANYVQYMLKIPAGVSISHINISGSIKKNITSKSLQDVLDLKGYSIQENDFYVAKNLDDIIVCNKTSNSLNYIKITRRDLFNDYNISSIIITPADGDNIKAKFIEIDSNKVDFKTVIISNDFNSYFDLLTFTPIDSDIYAAINSYNVIFPLTDEIQIVNTFTKGYDISKKMFYKIESLNEKYQVIFKNNESMILDESSIMIKRKSHEDMSFNYEIITIEKDLPLGTTVDLPSSFILPNKEKIELDKYIITNDLNIVYKTKNDIAYNSDDFLKVETLYVDTTGFNKLKYSNVHEMISVNVKDTSSSTILNEGIDYIILNEAGIIIWTNEDIIKNNAIVDIKYYIKKAYYIAFEIETLYQKVKYNINSLYLINDISLEKISLDQEIDLNIYDSYKDSDLTSIYCTEPGFVANIENDILKFSKTLENNTIAVKTGFYYMDGNEYYMFADDNFDNIEKIDSIYLNNVIKENKKFILKQQTTNFITNSSMKLNVLGEIFNLKCSDKEMDGVSELNSITACESFNYWKVVASNLAIVKGVNGQGIGFTSMKQTNGYAYIPLTGYLSEEDKYILTFYLLGSSCEAYLAKERIIHSTNSKFNKESVIDLVCKINESEIEDNIYEIEFNNSEEDNFFLVINNTGIIDDIIVINKNKYEQGMHKKNIDHLGLNIEENIYAEYNTRMFLTEEDGATLDGTEITIDKSIINSSYVHWGFTSIKEINKYEDFKKCVLTDIDLDQYNNKCIAKTESSKGVLITNPIYVGNVKIIKNLLFKINNVMFDNMKGFKVKILTADNVNAGFKEVSRHLDNIGCISGDNLSSYIKLMVEMPSNKVINNIELFIEYLSNEVDTPADMSVLSGTYKSKVLDAQYNERFLVKNINFSEYNKDIKNYIFQVRASKENDEKTTWTDWKTIVLKNDFQDVTNPDIIKNGNILNRIVFDGYRFFQFNLVLKGEDASIKANYIDLEVI